MQLVFECVSRICRDLCRQLSADLPGALKATVGLRYSHASYVRELAVQSLGLLFRHAGNSAHKRGLMALYAGGSSSSFLMIRFLHPYALHLVGTFAEAHNLMMLLALHMTGGEVCVAPGT